MWLSGELRVRAAFRHDATARRLVHRLKYQAIAAAALPLAVAMAPAARGGGALVPVPRAPARRWRYGVDPARELAAAVGRITGMPVVAALLPGWWHPARAGPSERERGIPRFRAAGPVPERWVLVDDVVTTGATLRSAARALPGRGTAVVATAAQAAAARCR